MGKLDKDKGKGLGNYTAREDKDEDTRGEDIFTRDGEKDEDTGNIKFDEDNIQELNQICEFKKKQKDYQYVEDPKTPIEYETEQ